MLEIISAFAENRRLGGVALTEKELRKLNRYQLLELLMIQTQRAEELQAKLEELEAKVSEQEIRMSTIGSIAEASLQLSGVFESAQRAADLYMDAVQKQAAEILATAQRRADYIAKKAALENHSVSIQHERWLDV